MYDKSENLRTILSATCHALNPVKLRWTNQSTGSVGPRANEMPTEAPLATRGPRGQRLGHRIGRKSICVLIQLTSVGTAACTFNIDNGPENWPTANLRHVSALCVQYGVGPRPVILVGKWGLATGKRAFKSHQD